MYPKAVLAAALLLQAVPTFSKVLETLATVPTGWVESAAPSEDATISLQIGLAQQNIDQLESKLFAISTPGNAEYGQHLDYDAVNAMFAPTAEATAAVQSWLTSAGITGQVSSDGHWISFATTVGKANSLLNTKFANYESSGVKKLRTTQYSVPDEVASYIDLISPTTYFGKTVANIRPTRTKRVPATNITGTVDAACQTSITPQCIKEMYSVGSYVPDPRYGSRIGFGSFLNESAIFDDLFIFEKLYNIPTQNFSVVILDNGQNDQNASSPTAEFGEANLDIQNIIGVSHPLPVVEIITGGSPPYYPDIETTTDTNEPYLPYYQYLLSQPNSALPQVISNSYGDDEQTVPYLYAARVCNMIGMMGLRGITILESSGDTGVGAGCKSNDGLNTTIFMAQFPGTCPYVTAVGGTQAVTPEVAWDAGSGGFSNYFNQPAYQAAAVDSYLTSHISPAVKKYYEPYTNFLGRGFPDISAHSLTPDYNVIYGGVQSPSGGTSAAAPVVAGIIGLLNDARFRYGKPPLGFINPFLYYLGYRGLNDITGGSAVGCNGINGQTGAPVPGGGIVPWATWNATVGWDPVTGLGTPNFAKLVELALAI